MFPCDEPEQDRLDMFHRVLSIARRECLHYAPIPVRPDEPPPTAVRTFSPPLPWGPAARILDLGCGTGIWAMEMAQRYPAAFVLGIDLAPIQPRNRPVNCEFQAPRDFEDPWFLGDESWDLIRLQMGAGSVSSWPNLYQKVLRHLRPGGYFEQIEIDFEPRWDYSMAPEAGGGLSPDQPLWQWYASLADATARAMRPIAYNRNMPQLLKDAGFVEVEHTMIGLPLNTWPPTHHDKVVGQWYNLAFSESSYSLLLGPLSRVSGWPVDRIAHLASAAKQQAYKKGVYAYNLLHIFTARRPAYR